MVLSLQHSFTAKTSETLYHTTLPPVKSAHMFLIQDITHGRRRTKREIEKTEKKKSNFCILVSSEARGQTHSASSLTSTFLHVGEADPALSAATRWTSSLQITGEWSPQPVWRKGSVSSGFNLNTQVQSLCTANRFLALSTPSCTSMFLQKPRTNKPNTGSRGRERGAQLTATQLPTIHYTLLFILIFQCHYFIFFLWRIYLKNRIIF